MGLQWVGGTNYVKLNGVWRKVKREAPPGPGNGNGGNGNPST